MTSQRPIPSPPNPTIEARLVSTAVPLATILVPQPPPDTFLIYPLLSNDLATSASARSPEAYQRDVVEAVTTDLTRRLGESLDSIHLVDSGYLEIQLASPCGAGSAKGAADPSAGGLSLGFEVLLEAGSTQHRYIGVGGLAYYCGPQ